jgi:hypothetical protein
MMLCVCVCLINFFIYIFEIKAHPCRGGTPLHGHVQPAELYTAPCYSLLTIAWSYDQANFDLEYECFKKKKRLLIYVEDKLIYYVFFH